MCYEFLFDTTKSNCMAEKPAWFFGPQTKPPFLLSVFHPKCLKKGEVVEELCIRNGEVIVSRQNVYLSLRQKCM